MFCSLCSVLGIGCVVFVVGVVGCFDVSKGMDLLIEVFCSMVLVDVVFVIFGEGK